MVNDNPKLRDFARAMRKEPTPAEEALWRLLRNRRLAGFKFRRQHPFGPYILDKYCARAKVVVELDGDSHATPEGQAGDRVRDEYLAANGILVLRIWNDEVHHNQDGVIETIAKTCAERVAELTEGRAAAGGEPFRTPHPLTSLPLVSDLSPLARGEVLAPPRRVAS